MDYVEQLIQGIEKREVIDKCDALLSILAERVRNVIHEQTKEDVEPLIDLIMRGFYALYDSNFNLDNVYNDPVDIGEMTESQRAYLCGKLSALQHIASFTYAERPTVAELKVAQDNVSRLESLDGDERIYDSFIHGDLYENGLIDAVRYGRDLVCVLTPFAKDVITKSKQQ